MGNSGNTGNTEERMATESVIFAEEPPVKLFFHSKIISVMPKEEQFNLTFQMRKSCVSITENIAEGYGRFHYQELLQFCRISRGSLYELKDDLITCSDLKYISKETYDEGVQLIESAKVTLNGYMKYVKEQKTKFSGE